MSKRDPRGCSRCIRCQSRCSDQRGSHRAGVGISALYPRYDGKEDLLRQLCIDELTPFGLIAEAALADEHERWTVFAEFMGRAVEADASSLTPKSRWQVGPDRGVGLIVRSDQRNDQDRVRWGKGRSSAGDRSTRPSSHLGTALCNRLRRSRSIGGAAKSLSGDHARRASGRGGRQASWCSSDMGGDEQSLVDAVMTLPVKYRVHPSNIESHSDSQARAQTRRVLSRRLLNRTFLERQMLVPPKWNDSFGRRWPVAGDAIPDSHLPYFGLWARLQGFRTGFWPAFSGIGAWCVSP